MPHPTSHRILAVTPDFAVGSWNEVLLCYFPTRVTPEAMAAVHELHVELRAAYPTGTATFGIVGSGLPVPGRDVRAFAAEVGREASGFALRGECIVLRGHPFWVGMARSALRAIQIVAKAWHPRAVYEDLEPASRWVVKQLARPADDATDLVLAANALLDACTEARGAARASRELA